MKAVFGHIPGVPIGTTFNRQLELSRRGVHRPLQAGICGTERGGAESIILNACYEDDVDLGDTIYYTGHGGRDPGTRCQVADQVMNRGNLALKTSHERRLPVRVIRGWKGHPNFSPKSVFRYDGLYCVEEYHSRRGKAGYKIWLFKLTRDQTA